MRRSEERGGGLRRVTCEGDVMKCDEWLGSGRGGPKVVVKVQRSRCRCGRPLATQSISAESGSGCRKDEGCVSVEASVNVSDDAREMQK